MLSFVFIQICVVRWKPLMFLIQRNKNYSSILSLYFFFCSIGIRYNLWVCRIFLRFFCFAYEYKVWCKCFCILQWNWPKIAISILSPMKQDWMKCIEMIQMDLSVVSQAIYFSIRFITWKQPLNKSQNQNIFVFSFSLPQMTNNIQDGFHLSIRCTLQMLAFIFICNPFGCWCYRLIGNNNYSNRNPFPCTFQRFRQHFEMKVHANPSLRFKMQCVFTKKYS